MASQALNTLHAMIHQVDHNLFSPTADRADVTGSLPTTAPQQGDREWDLLVKINALLNGGGAKVGGNTVVLTPTIINDTSGYAAGDCIGGQVSLQPFVKNHTGVLSGITIVDRTNVKPSLEIYIFDSVPTGATVTDQAPFAWGGTSSDTKVVAKVVVANTDWTTLNNRASAELANLNRVVAAAGGDTLYMVIITTGTPTFVFSNALQLKLKFLVD